MAQASVRAMFSFLVVPVAVNPNFAQDVCGQYETAPGATVRYSYMPGSMDFETLPVSAEFNISCNDYSLAATILTPIIGVDEDGNEIFPTGLTYPLATAADYQPGGYMGSLQGTQYNYGWEFESDPGGAFTWNGFVSWFGGRYEETTIENVALMPIPEPTSSCLLLAWVAIISAAWRRH